MTNNTLKEQFLDLFNENTNSDIVWGFIESKIAQARKDERKELYDWIQKNRNTVTLVNIENSLNDSGLTLPNSSL